MLCNKNSPCDKKMNKENKKTETFFFIFTGFFFIHTGTRYNSVVVRTGTDACLLLYQGRVRRAYHITDNIINSSQ